MAFKKAVRNKIKAKIALTGPTGSGKTYSAILLARGLAGETGTIAFIDTERDSARLYADLTDFDVDNLQPPFTVETFISKMKEAQSAGYDVLVIDSISHQWKGEGGMLDQSSKKQKTSSKNSFTVWGELTPEHERFVSAILDLDMHVICTMRSKMEYVLEQDDRGKAIPRKVGLSPIQGKDIEYEFTVILDLCREHLATVSKTRINLFKNDIPFVPDENTGRMIFAYLDAGVDPFAGVKAKQEEFKQKYSAYFGDWGKDTFVWIRENGFPIQRMSDIKKFTADEWQELINKVPAMRIPGKVEEVETDETEFEFKQEEA